MASRPGILTDWPWTPLGSTFKYLVLVPFVVESTYSFLRKGSSTSEQRSLANFLVFFLMLWRMVHNQIWITLSRHRTAKGNNRIVDKPIEFDQVDREENWDDNIIFNTIVSYVITKWVREAHGMPIWRADGAVLAVLLHAGPVEFLYYWLHRALHHHFLYSRYHSHHHSSIVTQPITSVTHPFGEHISYTALFLIPHLGTIFTGTSSIATAVAYITYIDFMNNLGHCNFELIPNTIFSAFPLLKFLIYTPSFHSLHHTQFRTNYSLFMPIYDYIYGTVDKSTDSLYEDSLRRPEELADVVHLTHLTTPDSIFHLRLGFASLASKPSQAAASCSSWYLWLMWPLTFCSIMVTSAFKRTLVLERNRLGQLNLQTWAIPKYKMQYKLKWEKESINSLIEGAVLEAEQKGVKVLSLGLLNQAEEVNGYGELYLQRNPHLKVKLVDGSSLAAAVVLNTIPKGTTKVLIKGNHTKVAYAVVFALCQKGIQIETWSKEEHDKLNRSFGTNNIVISKTCSTKVWLVGDGVSEEEVEAKAKEGTIFIPFCHFPPIRKLRKDCCYHTTPAMATPQALENVDSCENWLPRRVMSAWRVAGIVHALEGWEEHECGFKMANVDKIWEASIRHGFQPLN